MAVINYEQKWLYLMEPRTASRATNEVLIRQLGGRNIGTHHMPLNDLTDQRKPSQTIKPEYLKGYNILCTVRNPYDALIGNWRAGDGRDWDFATWVDYWFHQERVHVPLHRRLWTFADIYVYYEHLQEDLDYVFGTSVDLKYDPEHKTKGKSHWSTYMTDDIVDKLHLFYKSFMRWFGYELVRQGPNRYVMTINSAVRNANRRQIRLRGGTRQTRLT